MRRRIVASLTAVGALCAAGFVYAQQTPPEEAPILAGPDGPVLPPEESPEEPVEGEVEEAPPSVAVTAEALRPDPVLAAEENRASIEVAEEAAEEIPLEEIEPPPPPPPPLRRPHYASAVIMAVDKIGAEKLRFEAKVGQPVRYKGLVFTLRACETTASDETVRDEIAHIEVVSQPKAVPGRPTPAPREVFKGWAFASSPALNPIQHPLYDAWLVGCVGVKRPELETAAKPKAT